MTIRGGYWGKILCVDLFSEEMSVRTFDDTFARKYMGGVGLAARIIYGNVTEHTNPLGSGNVLVFATGPYQATTVNGSGRCSAAAKSPLTGYWGESSGGARLGPELKRAGFDAIAITGRAKGPVYLWIKDSKAEIRDASNFWRLETPDAVDALTEAVGDNKVAVASIGLAGENLVRFASIANDKHGYFGRCGLGAVMGSKNLKAVVVRGMLEPPIADPRMVKQLSKEVLQKVKASAMAGFGEDGQQGDFMRCHEEGLLPMKNWLQDTWSEAEQIGTPRFTQELKAKPWGCPYCALGGHRRITNPVYASKTAGPEYESMAFLGANLLISDLGSLVKANDLCNRYGMDTIELGGVLGWAFECYEKGLITKEDTGGVDLRWSSGEALIEMLEKVARREGIGNLLAEGLRACVERIPQSKPFAVEVMGQTPGGHDPRAYFSQTVSTIASPRGSCHIHGFSEAIEQGAVIPELEITELMDRFDATKKGYIGAIFQDIGQLWNSLIMCMQFFFADISLTDQVNLLNAITGWDVTPQEAQKMGERTVCLQHMFNLKNGLVPEKENVMPERFTTVHKEGGAQGQVVPWQDILKEYWETKGWVKGVPTKEKIVELGLDGLGFKRSPKFSCQDYGE
ncbi:aldehyde ferredoxin oxidoreductase family protein [Chloroflexota bacterium]